MTNEVFANSPNPGTVTAVGSLAAGVTASATAWTLNAALPAVLQSGGQFHALIDHEIVVIPTQTGTSLTGITRGSNLSSPDTNTSAAHLAGASIYPLLTAGALENALSTVGSSTAIATWNNVSTAQTLNSFVVDPVQIVNLTGNPVITIPAGPAGAACAGVIEFVQDTTAGRTWSYSGSVYQPGGSQTPGAGPNQSDYAFIQWDGSQWAAFPATSGPVILSALGVLIEGGASGLSPLRELGSQATGSTPAYTPSSANVEMVPDTGASGGFGIWYSPVGSTAWTLWNPTGGGGSLPTGTALQGLAFNRSAAVIAENRQLVDVTAESWTNYPVGSSTAYSIGSGVTNNAPGLMAAAYELNQAGKIGTIPGGLTLPFTQQMVFGNGSSTAQSTWSPYLRGCGVPPVNSNSNNLTSTLKWTGGAGMASPLVVMQGPFQGWEFSRITIDGNSTLSVTNAPVLGLQIVSAQSGIGDFLNVWNTQSGIQHTTVGVKTIGGVSANCSINSLRRVNVQMTGGASPSVCYGVQFTEGSGANGNGNCCYENYDDLSISQTTGTGASGRLAYGVYYQRCDSVRVRTLHIGNGGLAADIVYEYNGAWGNLWPAGCFIDGQLELGGNAAPIYQIGAPTQATTSNGSKNIIASIASTVNGTTPDPSITQGVSANISIGTGGTLPLVTNTTWGSNYLHGQAALVSGTKNITCKAALVGMPVEVEMITPTGTPGICYGTVSASGTITLTSLQPGTLTTQTGDTSTYLWRLLG